MFQKIFVDLMKMIKNGLKLSDETLKHQKLIVSENK